MGHSHVVRDTGARFIIDQFTRQIKNVSENKTTIVQYDHNSQQITFEMPLQIDSHVMTLCNLIELHFINISTDGKSTNDGTYEVKDIHAEGDKAVFTWTVSQEATQLAGSLNFLITFKCTENGVTVYRWSTELCKTLSISAGMDNGAEIITEYPDILAQWKAQLFEASDDAVVNVATAQANAITAIEEAKQAVLDSLPDEYEEVTAKIGTNAAKINELANAIKGNLVGDIVRADDVSTVEHEPFITVRGKNLFDISKIETNTSLTNNGDGTIVVAAGAYHVTTGKRLSELCPRLSVGDVCILSFENLSPTSKFFHLSITGTWFPGKARTITREMLNSTVAVYGCHPNDETYGTENVISDIQVEFGETATEYTPYIDPATITVARHGKNLLKPSNIGGHVAYNATNDLYTISATGSRSVHTLPVPVPKGTKCTVRIEVISGKITNPGTSAQAAVIGGYHVGEDGINSWQCAAALPNGEGVNLAGRVITKTAIVTETVTDIYFFFYASTVVIESPIVCKVQFEIGDTATEYEAYKEEQVVSANSDGTVSGLTSLSPTMTILTNTEGVEVDCEYTVDTKTYIDNKIEEMMEEVTG